MSDLPTSPGELGPDRLTGYLREAGLLGDGRVVAADHEIIGTGKMGDNARYTLSYEGAPPEAPNTLVAKLPAADDHARAIAGSLGAYYNEVMFYRHLATGTSMRTPAVYGSEISDDRLTFLLLMQDMSPAEPGDQLVGESRERASIALHEASRLASAFHGDPGLAERDYVMSAAQGDGGALGQSLLEESWPGFVDRFGAGLSAECLAFGEGYVPRHARFATRYQGPRTLVHGDFRSENILFLDDTATTVDWQTTSESGPLTDAAYFLGGSVDTEDRRRWERDLIEEYRTHLEEQGVAIDASDCWDQYRESAMHGLLITVLGASFSSPEERSDRMFLTMIQRHLQHCVDLGSGEFLS